MRGAALALLLLAGCRAPEEKPAPSPAPPPAPAPALDEAAWRAEAEQRLFERHMDNAKRYRDALEIESALDHVERALTLRPMSEPARALRAELQRMAGQRAGETTTLMQDAWEAQQVREEQRVVEAQRMLAEAREAEEAGDLERAATLYQRAAFLAKER